MGSLTIQSRARTGNLNITRASFFDAMSGQRTLSLEMREFDPTDYPRLLEIYNANYPDYSRSIVEWRSRDETVDRSKYYWQRYSFLERKAIVGFGDVSHVTDMFHPH